MAIIIIKNVKIFFSLNTDFYVTQAEAKASRIPRGKVNAFKLMK